MKKGAWKRAVAFGMAFTMLLSVTACGGKEGSKDGSGSKQSQQEDTKDLIYSEDDSFKLEGLVGSISSYKVAGDKLYIFTAEYPEYDDKDTISDSEEEGAEDEEGAGAQDEDAPEDLSSLDDYKVTNRLYSANLDGSGLTELKVPEFDDGGYVESMFIGDNGIITYVVSSWNEKAQTQSWSLVRADQDGNKSGETVDLTKTLNLGENDWLQGTYVDKQNRFYAGLEKKVVIIDENGKSIGELKVDTGDFGSVSGFATTKDGQLVAGITTSNGAIAQVIDADKKAWGEKYELNISYFNSNDAFKDGVEYDFYYSDDKGVYGYDIAGKKYEKLMDFLASDMSTEYSSETPTPISKDQMLKMSYDQNDGTESLILLTKVDPSTVKDKQTIVLGAAYSVGDGVKNAVLQFNKSNDQYRIQLKDYSNEEDPQTKMNADIASGNVPDIISLAECPFEQYVQKGILEDLTSYYEKDSDVSLDDLVPSVKKAIEFDGKYYYVAPSMYISTLMGKADVVGTETGWTFDEFKAVLEKNKDKKAFFFDNKDTLLSIFSYMCAQDYVDWNTGKCDFESDEFKNILEFCNTGSSEEPDYASDDMEQQIIDGKVMMEMGTIYNLSETQMYSALFGGDVNYIGYPDKDKNGSYFNFGSMLGIYAKSGVKDGAWEFLKSLQTKEAEVKNNHDFGLPTRQDALEMKMKEVTTTETYTDEFGQEIEPVDYGMGMNGVDFQMKPLSKEQESQIMDLINRTNKVGSYDTSILDIITEEAKAYFDGQKSVDETAKIIQNRVSTYVNESR